VWRTVWEELCVGGAVGELCVGSCGRTVCGELWEWDLCGRSCVGNVCGGGELCGGMCMWGQLLAFCVVGTARGRNKS